MTNALGIGRGGRRPGAGRKKGVPNRISRELIAIAEAGGIMPLDYLLEVMRDPEADDARRDRMAIAAAPFLHPRLKAVDSRSMIDLSKLSDDELVMLDRLVQRLNGAEAWVTANQT